MDQYFLHYPTGMHTFDGSPWGMILLLSLDLMRCNEPGFKQPENALLYSICFVFLYIFLCHLHSELQSKKPKMKALLWCIGSLSYCKIIHKSKVTDLERWSDDMFLLRNHICFQYRVHIIMFCIQDANLTNTSDMWRPEGS